MAKSQSILNLQGTLAGITHVDSRTYGKHIRAARGTHSPAAVNESFKENSGYLISSNKPAQMIKAALDPHCQNFRCGQLWQRLLSIFRSQFKAHGRFNFLELEDLELHREYPLDRFIQVRTEAVADPKTSSLEVVLRYNAHPLFKKPKYADGYQLSLIALYPDIKQGTTITAMATSPVIGLSSELREQRFSLSMPPDTEQYLLCLKLEGTEKERLYSGMTTKGMRFVKSGMIR